jgi:hypothetical protein
MAAMASPAPGSADLVHRRQLEKSVSWSGRERLRCLWYRLRLTVGVGKGQRPSHKELKMRTRKMFLPLVASAPAVAVLISSCASQNVAHSNLTMQCTETLTGQDVTNGGAAGTGHCTITGLLHDRGATTDYRTQNGTTAIIRRVVTGAKGTITFVITINLVSGASGEPWKITSGTKAYAKLHGQGQQVVDNYQGSPATFVLKGTVSPARA